MPRKKSFGKRNQHSLKKENAYLSDIPIQNGSASKNKLLANENFVEDDDVSKELNNIIILIGLLSNLLMQSVKCKYCNNSNCMVAEE